MWRNLCYPNEGVKRGLGLQPVVDLETGLRETLEWLKMNSDRDSAEGRK